MDLEWHRNKLIPRKKYNGCLVLHITGSTVCQGDLYFLVTQTFKMKYSTSQNILRNKQKKKICATFKGGGSFGFLLTTEGDNGRFFAQMKTRSRIFPHDPVANNSMMMCAWPLDQLL